MNAPSKSPSNHLDAPVRFSPALERPGLDEANTPRGLIATMRYIGERTFADGGHAIRPVHAKSHGILEGYLEVDAGLPGDLALAKPGGYALVMRFSASQLRNCGRLAEAFTYVCRGASLDWTALKTSMSEDGRYHIETY
jgi:hypothetical protein